MMAPVPRYLEVRSRPGVLEVSGSYCRYLGVLASGSKPLHRLPVDDSQPRQRRRAMAFVAFTAAMALTGALLEAEWRQRHGRDPNGIERVSDLRDAAVLAAVVSAVGLLLWLPGVGSRGIKLLGGLVVAGALVLPAAMVTQFDFAGDGNGFGGCGSFLRPQPIAQPVAADPVKVRAEWAVECREAHDRQRTTVAILALPPVAVAAGTTLIAARGSRHRPREGSTRRAARRHK